MIRPWWSGRTRDGTRLLRSMFDTVFEVAGREGYPPSDAVRQRMHALAADVGSKANASMMRDLVAGHRTEADHLTGDLLERMRRHGLENPYFVAAYVALQAHSPR